MSGARLPKSSVMNGKLRTDVLLRLIACRAGRSYHE